MDATGRPVGNVQHCSKNKFVFIHLNLRRRMAVIKCVPYTPMGIISLALLFEVMFRCVYVKLWGEAPPTSKY